MNVGSYVVVAIGIVSLCCVIYGLAVLAHDEIQHADCDHLDAGARPQPSTANPSNVLARGGKPLGASRPRLRLDCHHPECHDETDCLYREDYAS